MRRILRTAHKPFCARTGDVQLFIEVLSVDQALSQCPEHFEAGFANQFRVARFDKDCYFLKLECTSANYGVVRRALPLLFGNLGVSSLERANTGILLNAECVYKTKHKSSEVTMRLST